MASKTMTIQIQLPQGVAASMQDNLVSIKGGNGDIKRDFKDMVIKITLDSGKIVLSAVNGTKREKTRMGSMEAHLRNMIKGITEGHVYKLKICSGHFPMNVSLSGNDFIIKNFLGEKCPRVLKLKEGVSVKVDGQEVTVEGIQKELVSQTAADIEVLTNVTNRDRRVFQDGIYIVNKDGKAIEI